MTFSSLVGNERIKKMLRRAVAEGRTSQGLIMAGPRGVGKHRFALALAQAINCERPVEGDACGECLPCRKMAAGELTDVQTIMRLEKKQVITVNQMREMSSEAQFRPYEARRRVYIVDEAERLNDSAATSILKTLEEPPDTSLIILVTSKPYMLLETIRSRCQMLSFAPLSASELESYLTANFKRPVEEIRLLARLARGSIGRALEIDLGEYRKMRGAMMEIIEALAISRDTIKLMEAAEHLGRKLERPEFEDHIDVLMVLLTDLFHLKLGDRVASLTNAEIAPRLERAAESATLDQIMDWIGRIEQVLQSMNRNVNRQLAMESALISV